MRLDVPRALVAAHLFGTGAALLALQRPPAAHAGCAAPEALAHLPVAQPRRDGGQNTNAQIERERCRYGGLPPCGRPSESRSPLAGKLKPIQTAPISL